MNVPETFTPAAYNETYPRYLASERSRKKSDCTIKAYDLALRKFRDYLEAVNPDEITPLTVQEWADSMMDAGTSPNTVGQYWDSVSRFFKWAVRMKLLSESPMPEDGKPDPKRKKKEIPTKEEIMKLLDPKNIPPSIQGKLPLRNYTIVSFLILTGLRSDELRELRLSDLDFEENTVRVRSGKGGKERNVPFAKPAQKIIRKYLSAKIRPAWADDEDYLFGTHQHNRSFASGELQDFGSAEHPLDETTATKEEQWHKFDAATLGRLVHRYGKTVIGREIHPHLLRHCATSLWDDQGVDIRDVQQALGHASLNTTEKVYLHVLDKKKAAKTIAETLSQAILPI